MAFPTLWMYWGGLSNCSQCPALSLTATGSGATGSEGAKFNQAIPLEGGASTCAGSYILTSGPDAAYGFSLNSNASSPDNWTLEAHPAIGPAYYLLALFTFDCSKGWSGQAFNLPSTGANVNATGTLTITFS